MREQLASRENYNNALTVMQAHNGFHGVLRQLSSSLSWHVEKELGAVMSTTQRFTNIFDSPLVNDNTSSTSFDSRKLRTGKMTIYLINREKQSEQGHDKGNGHENGHDGGHSM